MCFLIDNHAVRPKNRKVWKIVSLAGCKIMCSIYYSDTKYWGGKVLELKRRAITSIDGESITKPKRASEGFYVYTRKTDALRNCYSSFGEIVISMTVDPSDWLYSNDPHCLTRICTYRKIKIDEVQESVTFY